MVTKIKSLITNNKFPVKVIDKEINKFVSYKLKNPENKVKRDINFYLCTRITKHCEKEKKK